MDHMCFLYLVFVMLSRLFIAALVVTCWERVDLFGLVFDVASWVRCGT